MDKRIAKPDHEVALLLTLRQAHSEKGRVVQEHVLFRVECGMWIREALSAQKG